MLSAAVACGATPKPSLVACPVPVTVKLPGVVKSPDNLELVTVFAAGSLIVVCVCVIASTATPVAGAVENVR